MKKIFDNTLLWIAILENVLQGIGTMLIFIVVVVVVSREGWVNFWSIRVGPQGLIVILIGALMIYLSKKASQYVEKPK